MNKTFIAVLVLAVAIFVGVFLNTREVHDQKSLVVQDDIATSSTKTALMANGCFWCAEADMEKIEGVVLVTSGYAGGMGENPTYDDYGGNGFREVVEITYDPTQVSYSNLVESLIKHGDPTDAEGSFYDRGPEYAPAVYYETEEEHQEALEVIAAIDAAGVFLKPITLAVIPRVLFWPAEEYHQDYYVKNPVRYKYYRSRSGRDAFINEHWGESADDFSFSSQPSPVTAGGSADLPWVSFQKPSKEALQKMLTPVQFKVTQENDTEKPFTNEYDKNIAEGIYVDIVSGEPLYSSKDKYDSGTGWPSFVKPITPDVVVLHEDNTLFSKRTEVRSRFADSHLGHVFDDGPADRGGKRYCMNSAAMLFIPKEQMEERGYGDYLSFL